MALIARDGTIDWLCWPQFESASIFASLLDSETAGSWSIRVLAPSSVTRAYVRDSNVLETRFQTASGVVTVVDAMTVASEREKRSSPLPEHELLRIVRCESGALEVEMRVELRPDFGRCRSRPRDAGALGIRLEHDTCLLTLRGDRPLAVVDNAIVTSFALRAGESVAFSLTFDAAGPALLPPLGHHALERMQRTIEWWQQWAGRMRFDGPYRDAVARSVLALKLLSFSPSGAVVAAPTTSLPEKIGGDLNWDYRYCWLRDAALTVHAMRELGYVDEYEAFCGWLLHTTRLTRPQLRVLYDVYGNLPKNEELVPLAGYRGSRPVRVRNAASQQLQLDCYGEVIDSVVQAVRDGHDNIDRETAHMLADFGGFVCKHWHLPDHGIWEDRLPPRHHTYSKVMCWVALDRLIELANAGHVRVPIDDLARHRAAIREDIEAHAFDRTIGSYTQTYGGSEVDASLVLMGWYGFEEPTSPRLQGTYREIAKRLAVGPGLYARNELSIARGEGAFGICSFWIAELLARGAGSLDEARAVFESALGYANDCGLFGEEIDPVTGEALGNFPQAYTHVGVINAASAIAQRVRDARPRAA